jgi:hypothetical protein
MSEVDPRSVTLARVSELRERLNSLYRDQWDAVGGREQRIAMLKLWVSEPACFESEEARAEAEQLLGWVS